MASHSDHSRAGAVRQSTCAPCARVAGIRSTNDHVGGVGAIRLAARSVGARARRGPVASRVDHVCGVGAVGDQAVATLAGDTVAHILCVLQFMRYVAAICQPHVVPPSRGAPLRPDDNRVQFSGPVAAPYVVGLPANPAAVLLTRWGVVPRRQRNSIPAPIHVFVLPSALIHVLRPNQMFPLFIALMASLTAAVRMAATVHPLPSAVHHELASVQ